jgi:hypothetical protein
VHDGIAFERRGIPAAVICTEPFQRMGRATAAVAGLPDYAFLLVPHPMGRLRPEELRVRAEETLPAVVALLVARPAPAVETPDPWRPDALGLASHAAARPALAEEPAAPGETPMDPSLAREAGADLPDSAESRPPVAHE